MHLARRILARFDSYVGSPEIRCTIGLRHHDNCKRDVIWLRADDIAQLFHTLDSIPFRERDIDREAEESIFGYARE
jgi:hypothetical protein